MVRMEDPEIHRTVEDGDQTGIVSVPKRWVNGEVAVTLQVPETPRVFREIEEGCTVSPVLNNGNEINGVVTNINEIEYLDGSIEYVLQCQFDESENNVVQSIHSTDGVNIDDVSKFELICVKPPSAAWQQEVVVQYYYDDTDKVEGVSDTVTKFKTTVFRDVNSASQ